MPRRCGSAPGIEENGNLTMPKPIRILHVLSRMNCGGAEMRMLEMFQHIDRRQYQFHFCALSGLPGTLDQEIRSLGGEVHLLRIGLVGFPRRFRRLLSQVQFDVVHSHAQLASGFILRLAAQRGTPLRVAFFHTAGKSPKSGPARRLQERLMRHWIDRYATHIVAVSEGTMDSAWGPHWRSDPRCRVIYLGVPAAPPGGGADPEAVRREFGVPAGAGLLIHVGRITEAKNHPRLVSIFARFLRRRPAARLLVVGRGGNEIERRLRQRIAELGIADRVVLCGERGDVPRLLEAADALLFPSLWEGLPGVVLEACRAGLPVLASDLPCVREIAARLPQVRYLSLDAGDERWAQVLEEIPTGPDSHAARQAARRSFAQSDFTIGRSVELSCRVWQGPRQEPTLQGVADG